MPELTKIPGSLGEAAGSEPTYQQKVFERYNSTSYARRNDLTDSGLDRAAGGYLRELGPYLPEDLGAPILEIGCGSGSFLALCRDLGYTDVRGLDISEEMVAFCRLRGLENIVCADALAYLRECGDRFALVVASDVLEHVPKQEGLALMREVRDRLRPGGKVLLRVPNMSNPLNIQARYGDYTHEVGFSKESLEQLLRNAGFEIETLHAAFGRHRRWLARLVFDRLLWDAFRLLCRHTLQLRFQPERGKNLIAVGVRAEGGELGSEVRDGEKGGYRAAYFDTYLSTLYGSLRNDLSQEGLSRSARAYALQLGPYLPEDRELPILEIGCGSGGFLRACEDLGYSAVHGIDISPEQVLFCHESGLPQVVCSDGSSYLEQDGISYGTIVMSDVLEHIPREEVGELLSKIRARLLPKGRLIVRVPNLSNPLNLRTRYVDLTHELGFTAESLSQVLEQSGFSIDTVQGIYGAHRRLLPRIVFDKVLWKAFRLFCREVMALDTPPIRGKNLLGVAVKSRSPDDLETAGTYEEGVGEGPA